MKVVLLIYYHEKASNLTTSEPSPREVVCRVAVSKAKLYKKRFKTRETGTSRSLQGARRKFLLVAMVKEGVREMEISARCGARDENVRAFRNDKRQDARDGDPLVAACKMGNSRLS